MGDFPGGPVVKTPCFRDFPGGPVVKNLPRNARDTSLIPGQGAKIPSCCVAQPIYTYIHKLFFKVHRKIKLDSVGGGAVP